MNTVHRRTEIINILIIRRHTTANELAQEFGVSIRTIQYLSLIHILTDEPSVYILSINTASSGFSVECSGIGS